MRWLSVALKQICDGRRVHRGISPVAVEEKVVGAAPAKRMTTPMKREDAMQGYWSVAVDEKRPSLAVDDAVLVGAPAWWRTVAMDVVEDGGDGWGGGRRLVWGWGVLARTVYEWENGGRGTGNHVFGTRLSEIWESYELSPRLKFGRLVGWG